MTLSMQTVSHRGQCHDLPSAVVCGRRLVVSGRLLRTARIHDEDWSEDPEIDDPAALVRQLHDSGLAADLLMFNGPLDGPVAFANLALDMDNAAVIRTSDFQRWWDGLPQEARKSARRAAKRGVVVREAVFDHELVRGIQSIYDETPVRQGRRFWHYGKDLGTIERENGSYLGRAHFLGAYLGDELIGFMKWVRVKQDARIMQILCLNAHQDKRPIIALIARAVALCQEQGCRYLIYGRYRYDAGPDSSVTEFKRRLGFMQVDCPRYCIALTLKGRLALRWGLQGGLRKWAPPGALNAVRHWRARLLCFIHAGVAQR